MTKKILTFFAFILISNVIISRDFRNVDLIASNYPKRFSSPLKLAERISSDFNNDIDKVRAVYTWIINNVIYDPTEYGKYNFEYSTKKELKEKQPKYEYKLASRVISKCKAVCEGYSILFNEVCKHLNIHSEVINGNAKTEINDIGRRFDSNHTWNMVSIADKKYLIDATWGAGSYENKFLKKLDYSYFFTDPKHFFKKHYPDKYENTLLKEKIDKLTFMNTPLYYNFDFELTQPIKGIIKKDDLNKINFKFDSNKKVRRISYRIDQKDFQIRNFKNGDNIEFKIDLSNIKRQRSLLIFFDNEPIVGFKLK